MILINRIMPKIFRINILSENEKKNNIHITVFLICIMIIFILYIIYRNKFVKREGIANKINSAIRDIRNVGNQVKRIPRDVSNVGRQIGRIPGDVKREFKSIERKTSGEIKKVTRAVDNGVKKIEKEGNKIINIIERKLKEFSRLIKEAVTKKLRRFFESLGRELKRAFVDPVDVLFAAIGTVFKLLGEIIKMIIDKIVSLPDCVPYYSMSAGKGMTKEFLPKWLFSIIMFFHKMGMFILNLLKPLLKLIGIDIDAWQREIDRKCYKFPVKGKTNKMESSMNKAGRNFIRKFGRINFRNIAT